MNTTRKVGSIARLVPNRVFGFIHCPEDARDYFFHQVHLENRTFGQLHEGDAVSFIVGQGTKGLEAQQVTVVDPGATTAPEGHETREQLGLPTATRRGRRRA